MQKYISKKDNTDIRYYELDVDVSRFINLNEYRLMTESEILEHETPKPSIFHTEWNGTEWIDIRTEEEKLAYKRSEYSKLTRYQFMRGMLENGHKSSDIEAQIMLIEDEYTRELTMLGFKDAGYFDRNNQSIGVMRDMLGKTDLEIDEFWELCMTF
ncbi:hypothetical protein [Acinetobacter sp. YH12255]|uniref:hypothetical protein n=1 Tax=Acinetobacter sp. YH12255 TaxID=2601179 RepID=UPI0015D35866|nr:hypothetical protein [Acinetobacter sp. YH12255]